jgi:hypothetical protein
MENHFIFARSEKTDSELVGSEADCARFRRFLALVDGKRTVEELSQVSRPDELTNTLLWLEEKGFIVKVGEASSDHGLTTPAQDPFAAAALTEDMFDEFKRRAVLQLKARFGAAADNAAERILQAHTPEELRSALRDAEGMIAGPAAPGEAAEVRELFLRIGRNFV